MTELIIAILSGAAGSVVTYRVMKAAVQKVENARSLATCENIGLRNRCQALDSAITERRVKDAYQAGYQSREPEVASLKREVSMLRDQVRLEAALDARTSGRSFAADSGGKIVNLLNGRG